MGRKKIERPEADRIKSILITRTAIKELISEDIVDRVINFQFKDFKDMVHEHDQIEVSGFGKFLVSMTKVEKKKIKLQKVIDNLRNILDTDTEMPAGRRAYKEEILKSTISIFEDLKTRTNGYENKS